MVMGVVDEDMDYLEVYVGATSMTMNERFTMLAANSPFVRAGARRTRRRSTNNGPLLNPQTKNFRNQNIIDEVVHQLGLDWRVHELQQINHSRPGSRASMTRYGSAASLSSLGDINFDQRSRASSYGSMSQHSARSGRSRRSTSVFSESGRSVRFNRQPGLNLDMRLQMRDAWMRGRRARARGRARGGAQNNGIARRNWYNSNQARGRGRGNRRGRGRRGNQGNMGNQGNQGNQGSHGNQASNGPGVMTRSRTRQQNGVGTARSGGMRGRGRGRGVQRGVSQNSMPPLKTLEQLDKELDEYMASTPATLDKQLEEYMAQTDMDFDL